MAQVHEKKRCWHALSAGWLAPLLLLTALPAVTADIDEDYPGIGLPTVTESITPQSGATTGIPGLITLQEAYYVTSTGKTVRFRSKKHHYLVTPKKKPKGEKVKQNKIRLALAADLGDELEFKQDARFRQKIRAKLKQGKDEQKALSKLRNKQDIDYISAILLNEKGNELGLSPGIVIRLSEAGPVPGWLQAELATLGLSVSRPLAFTDTSFLLDYDGLVEDPSALFQAVRAVMALPGVEWAEPNFEVVTSREFTPDDTLFVQQWHLQNTGQNSGLPMADINAVDGWDFTRGTGMVVAIVDDGMDLSHPDLPIWNNPGESGGGKETDGIDNDANGYIDDFQGWDFNDSDNNPSPASAEDNHGTAVAGVAAARGDNTLGVTGSAGNAQIIPIRMTSGTCATLGDALRYAARHADVVNGSWSVTGCESEIDAAISDAVSGTITGARRGDKGTPMLFASGNDAALDWIVYELQGVPLGEHIFEWEYSKDAFAAAETDAMLLDLVLGPSISFIETFDASLSLPAGWTTTGDASWSVVGAPDALSGNSAKSGLIGPSETSALLTTQSVLLPGELVFAARVPFMTDGLFRFWLTVFAGDPELEQRLGPFFHDARSSTVAYPSSNPNTISVGASNDGSGGIEERASYSQYGVDLDVVAPSSDDGVQGITTTDRQGIDGYDATDYTSTFGGTSAAAPLAAGVVADLLAIYPHLTAAQARDALRHGADQIGLSVPYTGDRDDFYGHGRINLLGSINWLKASGLVFDCDLNDQLVADRWSLIGLPCVGSTLPANVTTVLGDDMDTGVMNSDWIMGHKLNAGPNNYTTMTSTSGIDPGVGYWIKSTLGAAAGGGFLDDGWLDVAGTETPVVDSINCPSANGCFEIALNSPGVGDTEEWNMVAHPLAFPVDWADVRIIVDGTTTYVPQAAQTADILSATYQTWTGSAYSPFNDTTPSMEGTLQPGEGFWVKVLPGAIGRTVVLLIPAVPSLKSSSIDTDNEPWYANLFDWVIPAAHADEPNNRPGNAIGYYKREKQKKVQGARLKMGKDWFIKLSVEAPAAQLLDTGNALGQLSGSKRKFDRNDLQEQPPFSVPYLTLVFPHDDWGEKSGTYASDFHNVKNKDQWEFEIRTDQSGREINLCWEGNERAIAQSELVDLETGEWLDLGEPPLNSGCLNLVMQGTTKRYLWTYRK